MKCKISSLNLSRDLNLQLKTSTTSDPPFYPDLIPSQVSLKQGSSITYSNQLINHWQSLLLSKSILLTINPVVRLQILLKSRLRRVSHMIVENSLKSKERHSLMSSQRIQYLNKWLNLYMAKIILVFLSLMSSSQHSPHQYRPFLRQNNIKAMIRIKKLEAGNNSMKSEVHWLMIRWLKVSPTKKSRNQRT